MGAFQRFTNLAIGSGATLATTAGAAPTEILMIGSSAALHGTVLAQSDLRFEATEAEFSGTWTISPTQRSQIAVDEIRITAPLLINGGGQLEMVGYAFIASGASITVASGTTLSTNFGFEITGGDLNMHGHYFLENGGLTLHDAGRVVIQNGGLLDGDGNGNTVTINDGAEIRIKPGGTLASELTLVTNGTGRVVNEGDINIPAGD